MVGWMSHLDFLIQNLIKCISEPGYYHAGEFGIRIEDILCVVPATIANDFSSRGALTFKTATLAPIQAKMIDMNLINSDEVI